MKENHNNIESNILAKVIGNNFGKSEEGVNLEQNKSFAELAEQFTNFMIFLNCHEEVHKIVNQY
ncbi:MAG: hypothetical protein PF445_11955 [Melioribacteraceae bacterium]|jgi:hypothetical protein|nr:hypothetical protein [Melioribacteraceae bacterium]